MNYGKALRVARAFAGINQKTLAEAANLDASYISLIENGKRKPSKSTIRSLSKAIGIPPNLLTLLAAESDDLDLIEPDELNELGGNLMKLLLIDANATSEK